MDPALIASAALLGLAGTPHCAGMCGAPCAAATGGGAPVATLSFHLARTASYAVGGAIVASSVGALASLAQWTPALRPLLTMLHAGAFALGLWLLWRGRQPAWMGRIGRTPQLATAGGWQRLRGPVRAGAVGSLWVAWPCGLLQSALLVSAMASTAVSGAAVMAAFAVCSSAGLLLAPWLWHRYMQGPKAAQRERWVVRSAGAMLVLASGWTLGHALWHQASAFC